MSKIILSDIINIDVSKATTEKWQKLFSEMSSSGWYGREDNRVGFINLAQGNGIIAGYFANEGRRKAVLYDNQKEEVQHPPYNSFEHLFFGIFQDTAQVLIQSRRIHDYIDLNLSEMRSNFLDLLKHFFRRCEFYIAGRSIQIEDAGGEYSQDELYKFYRGLYQVTHLEVSNLYESEIPNIDDPKYKLYNPKEEWTMITWGAVADSKERGLDAVSMTARESVEGSLDGPIPKSLAGIGKIEEVRGKDLDGRVVIRKRTANEELEVELPPDQQLTPQLLEMIYTIFNSRGRIESWERRQSLRQSDNPGNLFTDEET